MIRNERQYRITKAQAEQFDRQLHALEKQPTPAGIHPRIHQAQRDAVQSQLDELREDLAAYEALQAGRTKVIELASLEELGAALIQARIAAGLNQRELAGRLGIKEQQIQRYEATDYAAASLERVRDVIAALGIKVHEDLFLPKAEVSTRRVLRRTASAGLSKDFVSKRILPPNPIEDGLAALTAARVLNRVFGWAPAALFGDVPLTPARSAMAAARFKLPANASTRATEAYAAYAFFVAGLMLRATPTLPKATIATDAQEFRTSLLTCGGLTLPAVVDYVWALGVPILPLRDAGAFHGATWRIDGRNVIVLKQSTYLESRWLYDLLHELRHAAEEPEVAELAFIDYETLAKANGSSPAETNASTFAGDVLLDGRAEELAKNCVFEAGGSVERLKRIVADVAKREQVPVAALANYMAFRLSLQGISWWGAATNLQTQGVDPWRTVRDHALRHLDLTALDDAERSILLRALEGDES